MLLFLYDYIVPFVAFVAIAVKIVVKSGKVMSRELFGINAFHSVQPSPVQSTKKLNNSLAIPRQYLATPPPALVFPLQNLATPPSSATLNPKPSNEVATKLDISLKTIHKDTPAPPFPSVSLFWSPPLPASPLQNPTTPPTTLKSIPSNEAATQKHKSLEKFLKNTPSPSLSETLPPPPPNTPTYQVATCFKKVVSSSDEPVMIRNESKGSDVSKSTSPTPCLYFPPPPPKNTPQKEKLLPHYNVVTPTCSNPPESDVAVIASPKSTVSSFSSFSIVITQSTQK